MAEVLEGADDSEPIRDCLSRFAWQRIHRAHAYRVAVLQRRTARRMGENGAWQVAIAEQMGAVLVGHDTAFKRLGAVYEDHRRR